MVVRKSLFFNSEGDNLRISLIQSSIVMSDYKILQILSVFRDPHTMPFTLHMRMRTGNVHSKDLQTNIAR